MAKATITWKGEDDLHPGDDSSGPRRNTWHGLEFKKGEPVETEEIWRIRDAMGNPFYDVNISDEEGVYDESYVKGRGYVGPIGVRPTIPVPGSPGTVPPQPDRGGDHPKFKRPGDESARADIAGASKAQGPAASTRPDNPAVQAGKAQKEADDKERAKMDVGGKQEDKK